MIVGVISKFFELVLLLFAEGFVTFDVVVNIVENHVFSTLTLLGNLLRQLAELSH